VGLSSFLSRRRKASLIGLGFVSLVLVGTIDYFAVRQLLEFSVFFLVPVTFFTWVISRRAGFLASAASAAIILAASLASPMHVIHARVSYWNALIWFGFFVLITLAVAQAKILYVEERQLSRLDALTRIANRRAFYEFAALERDRAQRYGQPITLAYLDLDGFKEINDLMGHDVGDKLLIWVARTMHKNIRRTDSVARIGGDEFAILLPNTDKHAAFRVLQKLLRILNRRMEQNRWPVTFSMGAVTFLTPPNSLQEMIRRADEAMYLAKTNGKNQLQQEELAA
jgi:diguanylate cyclase (GGDEF)-like protein